MAEKRTAAEYSADDTQSIEWINAWLEQRKSGKDGQDRISQAALARMARIGVSTFSQILSFHYAASPTHLIKQVMSAINHADEKDSDIIAAVETSVFKLVQTACTMARRYRNFALLSAYVGTGKTFALKHYTKHNANTHLLEADPTLTPQTLIKRLACVILGNEGGGRLTDQFDAVTNELKNTDSLIIVDEAETLTPKQLHLLRRLRDIANVGVVLAGTEYLTGLIKPEHGQFDQIRSRTGFWPETIRKITAEDATALVQAGFAGEDVTDEVISRLYLYSKGSARMLVEGLIAGIHQFRKGRELDLKLVDAVASQALCLQAIK